MNYVFFLFLEIGNSFFWCCNTCCISCSIRHQSVHFFRKMSIVSHLMTFSVKYRVIHMEKWPIFKIFLIKSNCCLPFHLWILFTNVSTYYKTSKNLKCQSESNLFLCFLTFRMKNQSKIVKYWTHICVNYEGRKCQFKNDNCEIHVFK